MSGLESSCPGKELEAAAESRGGSHWNTRGGGEGYKLEYFLHGGRD